MVLKKITKIISLIIFLLILAIIILFLIRVVSPREIDDISPEVICPKNEMEKSDILWVIPRFNNHSIENNPQWCKYILGLNKSLGMHGVQHEYQEFNTNQTQEYLNSGIKAFTNCFGFPPEKFKPPQLEINQHNKNLIKINGLEIKRYYNQITHKVYHCDEVPEKLSNHFIDLF